MRAMSILGLDIGTTGVKAVLFREDGTLLGSAYEEYDLVCPRPGHLELDPLKVLSAIREVTRAAQAAAPGDPVKSVAACTLGEAAVPLGDDGRPTANAIVGFDSRGDDEASAFRRRVPNAEVFAIAGHGINSFHTLFKILWRRDHDPAVFDRTRLFTCFGDYFMHSLGIPPRTDYSSAARTLAFDIHALDWSRRILDAAGLPAELFPPPIAPGDAAGEIGETASKEFHLPRGAVVGGGLHDQPAGILGAGVQPGESMLAIGTVICLGVRLRQRPATESVMAANNLCYYPTAGERQYVSIAFNFTGGSLLKWYRDQLAGAELVEAGKRGVDPYEVITEGLPDDPTRILVLPHFTTTGTPYFDPRALGAMLGLRLTTTRKEIVKSILEGILYEIRLNAELLAEAGVEIGRYRAIGGAARSPAWMQIAADVLDRPVAVASITEGAALGAALCGAKAAGLIASAADMDAIVERVVRVERVFEPRSENARRYSDLYAIYRDVYSRTKDISHRLSGLEP